MLIGNDPEDLPFGTFLIFEDELDGYLETQIDIQKAAVSEALAEFWNAINK